MSACRSCGAPIVWATSDRTGKLMPVDADPSPDGNVELRDTRLGPIAHIHGQAPMASGPLRLNHFVTCPDADGWHKPGMRP